MNRTIAKIDGVGKPTMPRVSRRAVWTFAAGLALGALFGPAAAWAADRVEVKWPQSVSGSAVKLEPKYSSTTFKVEIANADDLKRAVAPVTFQPLRETDGATVFVATQPDGGHKVMRLDHATGDVSPVGSFEL